MGLQSDSCNRQMRTSPKSPEPRDYGTQVLLKHRDSYEIADI